MNSIENKTILITGASQGIGEAAARFLAQNGAHVVLIARNAQKLDHLVSNITGMGGKACAVAGDVAQYETFERAVSEAQVHFGQLDGLINNAGLIDPIARIHESDTDAWGEVVDVNLKGVYHGLRAVLPIFLNQQAGTVINISSGAATSALEGWSHYCATKAAVLSLTRCANKEYGDKGVRVIGLSPGTVATDMQRAIRDSGVNPVSKLDWASHIPPEWVAKAIGYLMSDAADDLKGTDFSIKTDEGRARVGLPLVSKVA